MKQSEIIVKAVDAVPAVLPHLGTRARYLYGSVKPSEYKTYEYMLAQVGRLVTSVYKNNLGGEFIDLMANLISGQLTQAYEQAYQDEGYTDALPEYLTTSLEAMILNQYEYVDQFFRDIIDARIDETPIDPLLVRAQMWANQWNAAYKEAQMLIRLQGGGNLIWRKGATEHGCVTCANLDGIVMSAKEWDEIGVHPRGYPNPKLECEGGGPSNNCDCTLEPTEQRRTAGAYGRVEEIIL